MKYLVTGFRLCLRKATIKGKTTLVRRWVRKKYLDVRCSNKKDALGVISLNMRIDKMQNLGLYKYTIQCIGGKNGKR